MPPITFYGNQKQPLNFGNNCHFWSPVSHIPTVQAACSPQGFVVAITAAGVAYQAWKVDDGQVFDV